MSDQDSLRAFRPQARGPVHVDSGPVAPPLPGIGSVTGPSQGTLRVPGVSPGVIDESLPVCHLQTRTVAPDAVRALLRRRSRCVCCSTTDPAVSAREAVGASNVLSRRILLSSSRNGCYLHRPVWYGGRSEHARTGRQADLPRRRSDDRRSRPVSVPRRDGAGGHRPDVRLPAGARGRSAVHGDLRWTCQGGLEASVSDARNDRAACPTPACRSRGALPGYCQHPPWA